MVLKYTHNEVLGRIIFNGPTNPVVSIHPTYEVYSTLDTSLFPREEVRELSAPDSALLQLVGAVEKFKENSVPEEVGKIEAILRRHFSDLPQ